MAFKRSSVRSRPAPPGKKEAWEGCSQAFFVLSDDVAVKKSTLPIINRKQHLEAQEESIVLDFKLLSNTWTTALNQSALMEAAMMESAGASSPPVVKIEPKSQVKRRKTTTAKW
jgi:hypothetical protein